MWWPQGVQAVGSSVAGAPAHAGSQCRARRFTTDARARFLASSGRQSFASLRAGTVRDSAHRRRAVRPDRSQHDASRSGLRSASSGGSGTGRIARSDTGQKRSAASRDALLERIRAIPGSRKSRSTEHTSALVSSGEQPADYAGGMIGLGFYEVMRMPVVRGRLFAPADVTGPETVVVINEAFAKQYFPGEIRLASAPGTATFGSWASCAMQSCSTCDGQGHPLSIGWPSAESRLVAGIEVRTSIDPAGVIRPIRTRSGASTRASSPPSAPLTRSSPDRSHGSGWWPRPERCSVCSGSCWRAWGCSVSRRLLSRGARVSSVCGSRSAQAAGMYPRIPAGNDSSRGLRPRGRRRDGAGHDAMAGQPELG